MKIGLVTIYDNNNYGNRLQNYAVQTILEKYNTEVYTIKNYDFNYISEIKRYIKILLNMKNQRNQENRLAYFKKFNKNIKFSKYKIINGYINSKINMKYDLFFAGSDQIWNPNFRKHPEVDFLKFADKQKRNCISASFGLSELPDDYEKIYKENLSELKNISVREYEGKDIIEKLTQRNDVEVLVDPTMMLSAKEWDKVIKKPKQLKTDRYILNYFLGNLSEERKNEINRIANENDCQVINILDENSPFYKTGPSEFLYLEKNAFLICTDSFHSSIFAIIFNKPFIVFDRDDKMVNMNSRIKTLLKKFKLEDRYFDKRISNQLLNVDYEETYSILEEEKKKVMNFIKNVIK